MDYIKLNELCEINIGKTPSRNKNEYWGKGFNWLSISDLKESRISETKEEITDIAIKECNMRIVPRNTVVMSFKLSIGKTAILDKDMYTNEAIANFPIKNKEVIFPEYLFYALSTVNFNNTDRAVMGATLNKSKLNEIKIPYCNLENQKKIVNVLDKSQELINKRKEQIEALDELVKSKFIEMFGDPALNPMNWQVVELGSLLRQKASNGFFAKNNEYKIDGNTKVMWLGDIITRRYSNTKGLKSVDATEVQLNKYRVKYGDLLFCRSSLNKDGIGKASAVPKNVDNNIMFECHVIRAPLDLSKCIPEFIQVQSTLDYFRNQIMSNSKTATMTTIGQDGIIATKVILPDIKLQKQFVEIIYQIDKLKFGKVNLLPRLYEKEFPLKRIRR